MQATVEAEQLVRALGQVMRHVKRRAGQEMLGQHAAVGVLCCAAERDRPRLSDLAAETRLDLSTVSRHIRTLERDGYVARADDPADRRACRLEVTPQGRAALARMRERRVADIAHAVADWSPRDRRTLADLLDRLADDLNDDEHERGRADEPARGGS